MTNGIVYSVATGGDRVYLGGKFKSLRRCPTGVTCPDGTIKTVNVGALNATTGEGCGRSRSPSPATAPSSMPSPSWTASCTSVASHVGQRGASDEPRRRRRHDGSLVTDFSPEVGSTTDDYVRGMLARRHALHRRQVQDRRRLHETAARRLQRRRCAQRHVAATHQRPRPLVRDHVRRQPDHRRWQLREGGRHRRLFPGSQARRHLRQDHRGVGPVGDGREHLVGDVGLRPRRHL